MTICIINKKFNIRLNILTFAPHEDKLNVNAYNLGDAYIFITEVRVRKADSLKRKQPDREEGGTRKRCRLL